jgi:hypothetical protein
MLSRLHTTHHLLRQVVDTLACCVRVRVPDALALETIEPFSRICIGKMLVHREQGSSKYYRYVEQWPWTFCPSLQWILYAAALRGGVVIEADAPYPSQECSRCYKLSKPNGESFRCDYCGHIDDREAKAGYTLALRADPIGRTARASEKSRSGLLVAPSVGTEAQQCV